NRHILKVSFPDQDRALLGVIGAMKGKLEADPANADQYLAVVKALAGTDRVDAQGKNSGRWRGRPPSALRYPPRWPRSRPPTVSGGTA
ncbi:hypothetical protein, partial [Escherichia coli]|uniref:hypothetical protein n=1 Tax=Escherichia coli TaxID=562 RepID=UPI001954F886